MFLRVLLGQIAVACIAKFGTRKGYRHPAPYVLSWLACVRGGQIQMERDELYAKFESSIYEVQQKCGLKSLLLQRKVQVLGEKLEKKVIVQIHQDINECKYLLKQPLIHPVATFVIERVQPLPITLQCQDKAGELICTPGVAAWQELVKLLRKTSPSTSICNCCEVLCQLVRELLVEMPSYACLGVWGSVAKFCIPPWIYRTNNKGIFWSFKPKILLRSVFVGNLLTILDDMYRKHNLERQEWSLMQILVSKMF